VVRPVIKETTALGAAYAAGLAVGFFKDLTDLSANWSVDKTWKPTMEEKKGNEMYRLWKKAVTKSFDWIDEAREKEAKARESQPVGATN
jgi:glycerol kinase